jgi:hypothetical protein
MENRALGCIVDRSGEVAVDGRKGENGNRERTRSTEVI